MGTDDRVLMHGGIHVFSALFSVTLDFDGEK